MMDLKGTIIEESLSDKKVLKKLKILSTTTETVDAKHKTPWLKKWTKDVIEIPESKADEIAKILSEKFDEKHFSWYIDFKNDKIHYIIFPQKIFRIYTGYNNNYKKATDYGLKLGIPEYQLDFSPDII